jgi:hypothetical protein
LRSISSCTFDACRVGDDASHDTGGCNDRHVGHDPVPRAAVDGDDAEIDAGPGADDACGQRLDLQVVLKPQQPLEQPRALGARALLLKLHLQRPELLLELLVLGAHAAQVHVTAPETAEAAGEAGRAALHFRERTEGDDFEQRYARARVHLRRDEDDVPQQHSDEKHCRALTKIRGHGLQGGLVD